VAKRIEVERLTKWYGRTLALDQVTFEVGQGEIVGFRGPNGAGKSTTLRILTGFMPATEGRAVVNGHDVFTESLAVRASLGYMPENVPLYPEMRVAEYLGFRASLKGLRGQARESEIDRVVERCWLKERRRSLIGALSKGYRQRVGLAESLLGNPPVLLLDEPTIGLDPSQMQETRRLIRSLGESHTVLLSSHLLSEVERTCSHVVIIAGGRIAAAGSVESLRERVADRGHVVVEVRAGDGGDGPAEIGRVVGQAAGGADAEHRDLGDGWVQLRVTPEGRRDVREAIAAAVAQRGWHLREIHSEAPTLEELYLRILAGDADAGRSAA